MRIIEKILGKEHPDMRMVDQELIIRFFSMLEIEKLSKTFKRLYVKNS